MDELIIGKVVTKTRKIETALESIGANGKGLHEKVSSVEHILNERQIKQLRWIATVRNNVVHNDKSNINLDEFEEACGNSIDELKQLASDNGTAEYSNEYSGHIDHSYQPSRKPKMDERLKSSLICIASIVVLRLIR